MDAAIPCRPADPGAEFLIFAHGGSGYYLTPGGPRCAFSNRSDDELVPVMEIDKTLEMLRFSKDVFWTIEAGCQTNPPPAGTVGDTCTKDQP